MTDKLFTLDISAEVAMEALGAALGPLLAVGDVVRLEGPLGAGKTTLARGLIAALTGAADIPSPTFALVQVYEGTTSPLWHLDLYRLEAAEEIWELGLEEALETAICLIEWPEKASALLPPEALTVEIAPDTVGARRVTFRAGAPYSARWQARLASLAAG